MFLLRSFLRMKLKRNNWSNGFILIGAVMFVFFSCKKDNEPEIPILSTAEVTEILQTTAVSGGSISDNGGAAVTLRGVCWSTNQNPTINDNKTSDGSGEGNYISNLSGLESNTTYYVRAYATNTAGTAYGNVIFFTTQKQIELPTLITAEVVQITQSTAISGGNISHDGGEPIAVRGVVWGTTPNPDITNNEGYTNDGTGIGEFSSTITGLTPKTQYFVRAYASNSAGTAYGQQVIFSTEDDDGGNGHETLVVEVLNPVTGRIWMDRNLGASRAATSSTDEEAFGHLYQWGRGTDGHQLRASSTTDALSSSNTPGHDKFIVVESQPYDWRNPQNGNLWQGADGINNPCPCGFRLPTITEWMTERQSWSTNNAEGAYNSPLKLLMGGRRTNSGEITMVESIGNYWASNVNFGNSRYLTFDNTAAGMNSFSRAFGLSVRCIKD